MTKPRIKPTHEPIPEPEAPRRPRWASKRGSAVYADVALRTITDKIAKGELRAYKFGPKLVRINLDDVDKLMIPITNGAGEPQ